LVQQAKQTYPSKAYSSLSAVLNEFTAEHEASISAAALGIAGPVVDGTVKTTNLPWFVDARALARGLGIESVMLLNDLEAMGYGTATLDAAEFKTLNDGSAVPAAS